MTRAYGQATIEAAKRNPLVGRVKWSLSGSHPEPDDCNDKASRSSRDQPRGVYTTDEVPRYPSHPNCLCCLSPYVTNADIDAALKKMLAEAAPPAPVTPQYTAENPYILPELAHLPIEFYKKYLTDLIGDPTGVKLIPRLYQRPDVIPPYSPAATMAEAQEYGRALGIPDFYVGDQAAMPTTAADIQAHLNAANFTNEGLHDLSVRGVNLPDAIFVGHDERGSVAYYQPGLARMVVNASNSAWQGAVADVRHNFGVQGARGFFYSGNPADVIVHEVGHFTHLGKGISVQDTLPDTLTGQGYRTAKGISTYASTQPAEYVAEAFVKKFRKGKLSPDEQALYDKLGGPAIP